jgi:hypothetical protein
VHSHGKPCEIQLYSINQWSHTSTITEGCKGISFIFLCFFAARSVPPLDSPCLSYGTTHPLREIMFTVQVVSSDTRIFARPSPWPPRAKPRPAVPTAFTAARLHNWKKRAASVAMKRGRPAQQLRCARHWSSPAHERSSRQSAHPCWGHGPHVLAAS